MSLLVKVKVITIITKMDGIAIDEEKVAANTSKGTSSIKKSKEKLLKLRKRKDISVQYAKN